MRAKLLAKGARIRVLIVDDSAVIRQLVIRALEEDPIFQVVGTASNGLAALAALQTLKPDVITLDVEMPELDGIATLREIRKRFSDVFVIMFSTLTARSAETTLKALASGANDYVAKVANVGSLSESMGRLRSELIPKLKQFFTIEGQQPSCSFIRRASPVLQASSGQNRYLRPRKAVAIGVSTGGPTALAEIMPMFAKTFPVPVFIVQHMPAVFTKSLAQRLHAMSAIPIQEASEGMAVLPGHAYLAPGDYHMKIENQTERFVIRLSKEAPENSCRPAVDVMFRSIGESFQGNVIAVVLTGMGQDGKRGIETLRAKGATVIAQDQNSSVVWGMPGAVVQAGLADAVVDLKKIVPEIIKNL